MQNSKCLPRISTSPDLSNLSQRSPSSKTAIYLGGPIGALPHWDTAGAPAVADSRDSLNLADW